MDRQTHTQTDGRAIAYTRESIIMPYALARKNAGGRAAVWCGHVNWTRRRVEQLHSRRWSNWNDGIPASVHVFPKSSFVSSNAATRDWKTDWGSERWMLCNCLKILKQCDTVRAFGNPSWHQSPDRFQVSKDCRCCFSLESSSRYKRWSSSPEKCGDRDAPNIVYRPSVLPKSCDW